MKVKKNTDHTLIVEEVPWLFAIFFLMFILVFSGVGIALLLDGELAGLAFLGFGAIIAPFMLYLFVRRVQVVFHRPEGYVELRRRNLFGGTRVRHALAEIDRAVIEESQGSDSGTTYRVALVIPAGQSAGRHPVTLAYSSGRAQHRAAEAINAWLQAAR